MQINEVLKVLPSLEIVPFDSNGTILGYQTKGINGVFTLDVKNNDRIKLLFDKKKELYFLNYTQSSNQMSVKGSISFLKKIYGQPKHEITNFTSVKYQGYEIKSEGQENIEASLCWGACKTALTTEKVIPNGNGEYSIAVFYKNPCCSYSFILSDPIRIKKASRLALD